MKILVIGAGAIGLSCAYYLAKAGAEVTVLDAAEPGAGASRRNAGWVVPSMSEPVPSPAALRQAVRWAWRRDSPLRVKPSLDLPWIIFMSRMLMSCRRRTYEAGLLAIAELNRTTRQAFDEIEADGARFEHHRAGTLFAFTRPDTIEAHLADLDAMTAFGTPPARFLSGDDARSLEPALSQAVVGAIFSPGERHVDPSSFVDGMVRACTELGVKIIGGARVVDLHTRGSRASAALGGSAWPADAFVLAAGVWSPGVLRSAGIKLRSNPARATAWTSLHPPSNSTARSTSPTTRSPSRPWTEGSAFAGRWSSPESTIRSMPYAPRLSPVQPACTSTDGRRRARQPRGRA